jgi:hypothetical protein
MSIMKSALEKVGYSGPESRLNIALARAWNRYPDDEDAALRHLIEAVRNDAGVLWFLVPDDIRRALSSRLRALKPSESGEAGMELSPSQQLPPVSPPPLADGRHFAGDTQHHTAPAQPTLSAGGGHGYSDTQPARATAAPRSIHVSDKLDITEKPARAGGGQRRLDAHRLSAPANSLPTWTNRPAREPLGAVVVLNALRRETIKLADGSLKSLADATVWEVRLYADDLAGAARRLGYRAEWLRKLVANKPDEWVVGDHCTEDDLLRVQREARESVIA